MPGGSCSTHNDCYDDKACLGGRCCSFSQSEYNYTPSYWYYSSMGRYSNCTACRDDSEIQYTPGEMYWAQRGECTACKSGTLLITNQGNDQGIYNGRPGVCAPICNTDQYYDGYMNMCRSKLSAGQGCSGTYDNARCASGLCGYQYCCGEAASEIISGQCCEMCSSNTGQCLRRGNCSPPPPPPVSFPLTPPSTSLSPGGNSSDSLTPPSTSSP